MDTRPDVHNRFDRQKELIEVFESAWEAAASKGGEARRIAAQIGTHVQGQMKLKVKRGKTGQRIVSHSRNGFWTTFITSCYGHDTTCSGLPQVQIAGECALPFTW